MFRRLRRHRHRPAGPPPSAEPDDVLPLAADSDDEIDIDAMNAELDQFEMSLRVEEVLEAQGRDKEELEKSEKRLEDREKLITARLTELDERLEAKQDEVTEHASAQRDLTIRALKAHREKNITLTKQLLRNIARRKARLKLLLEVEDRLHRQWFTLDQHVRHSRASHRMQLCTTVLNTSSKLAYDFGTPGTEDTVATARRELQTFAAGCDSYIEELEAGIAALKVRYEASAQRARAFRQQKQNDEERPISAAMEEVKRAIDQTRALVGTIFQQQKAARQALEHALYVDMRRRCTSVISPATKLLYAALAFLRAPSSSHAITDVGSEIFFPTREAMEAVKAKLVWAIEEHKERWLRLEAKLKENANEKPKLLKRAKELRQLDRPDSWSREQTGSILHRVNQNEEDSKSVQLSATSVSGEIQSMENTLMCIEVVARRRVFRTALQRLPALPIDSRSQDELGKISEQVRKAAVEGDRRLGVLSSVFEYAEEEHRHRISYVFEARRTNDDILRKTQLARLRCSTARRKMLLGQLMNIFSEKCYLRLQEDQLRLAVSLHELNLKAANIFATPSEGSQPQAILHPDKTALVESIASSLESEIEGVREKSLELFGRSSELHSSVAGNNLWDLPIVATIERAIMSKRRDWCDYTLKYLIRQLDDFEHSVLREWSNAQILEVQTWFAQFDREAAARGEEPSRLTGNEVQLQSRLAAKRDAIGKMRAELTRKIRFNCTSQDDGDQILFAERQKRLLFKHALLTAQYQLVDSTLMRRTGPIQTMARGHLQGTYVVSATDLVCALESTSTPSFRDIVFAHKLAVHVTETRADFQPPLNDTQVRRMFWMQHLYGHLVDLKLTDGQKVFLADMVRSAQRSGVLSGDGASSLLLVLRLKGNIETKFVQLADVLDDIYRDFIGRLNVVETQAAAMESSLFHVKASYERGKRIAMWSGLVKFGLSMIPIAGQVAAAAVDMAAQGAEALSEGFFSESSMEMVNAVLEVVSGGGQLAVDNLPIEDEADLDKTQRENIAAAKLGRVALSGQFRQHLPREYRDRLVEVAESSWGASIQDVERVVDDILRSFGNTKDPAEIHVMPIPVLQDASGVDEDGPSAADVSEGILWDLERLNSAYEEGEDTFFQDQLDSQDTAVNDDDGDTSSVEVLDIEELLCEDREDVHIKAQDKRECQDLIGVDNQCTSDQLTDGRKLEELTEEHGRLPTTSGNAVMVPKDHKDIVSTRQEERFEAAISKRVSSAEKQLAELEVQSLSCSDQHLPVKDEGRHHSEEVSSAGLVYGSVVNAFDDAVEETCETNDRLLYHDDAVRAAKAFFSDDQDWLQFGFIEEALLDTDTDGTFRVSEGQFGDAVIRIVREIEKERSSVLSMDWAQQFAKIAPPRTGLINVALAKRFLKSVLSAPRPDDAMISRVADMYTGNGQISLAKFGKMWKALEESSAKDAS